MEKTTNVFTDGMIMDINELETQNTYCTSALNATVSTYNGNEGAIQNEMGNVKIVNNDVEAQLPSDTIILGSIEYGGVIYYVLYYNNPENQKTYKACEIGSFPSPDYTQKDDKQHSLIWNYKSLNVGLGEDGNDYPLISKLFEYTPKNPVIMSVEPSFDGSLNLILNDGIQEPKLINTGFHVQDNDKYKLVKRYNKNNTNRYNLEDETTFNLQTSLYRNFSELSSFEYMGTEDGGNLKVGNYIFYAVSCDKDGNESDIICESGVVSVFIGQDGDPFSVNGGVGNQNSYKAIHLKVNNIDDAYSYIKLYYTRTTAQNDQLGETTAHKIDRLYQIKQNYCEIIFTGDETVFDISIDDLNIQYFNANSAKAQAINQNMLFLGNIAQDNGEEPGEHDMLQKISVKIYPEVVINNELNLNCDYSTDNEHSYYSSKFIYNRTGYHDEEFYRFGIVYIRKDGSLTNVYDVLGNIQLSNGNKNENILTFQQGEEWNFDAVIDFKGKFNNKGVCRFNNVCEDIKDIIGIKFNFPFKNIGSSYEFTEEESKFLNDTYKGYFFVRQKRIPTILAQGYVTDVCEEAYLPSINSTETIDNQEYNLQLYESFVNGHFKTRPNNVNYPLSKSNSGGSYILGQGYKKHLFSISKNNTYAFFDRISASNNVFGAFYDFLGGWWGDPYSWRELNSGVRYDTYGGDDDDKYLTLYANNATLEGGYNDKADKYRADLYYFVKIETIIVDRATYENPGNDIEYQGLTLTYVPPVLKEQANDFEDCNFSDEQKELLNFEGWFYRDDDTRVIYKDNKSRYYLIVKENKELEYGDDSYRKWIQNLRKKHSFMPKEIKDAIDNNGDIPYWYKDDEVLGIALYVSNRCHPDRINVTRTPWFGGTFECPLYIEVGSCFYTYVAFGQGYSENKSSDMKNKTMNDLKHCIKKTRQKHVNDSDVVNNEKIDLDAPTFDGKYGFVEETDMKELKEVALKYNPFEQYSYAVYCPEYELNRPYYNNIFTGNDFKVKSLTKSKYLNPAKQRLYQYTNTEVSSSNISEIKAISVDENVSLVSLQHDYNNNDSHVDHGQLAYFSTKAGTQSEINFKFVGSEFLASVDDNILIPQKPFNIVRGIYGSYVGVLSNNDISNKIVNIYIPKYDVSRFEDYSELRAQNSSPYQAISDRITMGSNADNICYRGDCYIGYFTHRVNRNFQDPTSPFNDVIVGKSSFKDGFEGCFDTDLRTLDITKEDAKKFNLGDINAVKLGSWVTFPVRSTMNISLRAVDKSYVDERLLSGNDRSFYPLHGIDASGSYKIPESDAFNDGFNKSGSERKYFTLNQLVYNKVYYKNRIVYSNVLQQSALSNGNRVFLSEHYKDYTDQYGEIVKLISIGSNLLTICEHGILLVPVNERALAAEGSGGNVFINTSNVLPDNPLVISDTFGSKWVESIVNTPYGVFGVDESNKKIWYTDGQKITIISDFKVQEFLNNYLKVNQSLEIGECNIKAHYVKYKNDILFTLYDKSSDNFWNLCWNINEQNWRTFYSWIPIDSQNIGNNLVSVKLNLNNSKDNFIWKHGHSYRVPSSENILPTKWYDEQHPFEFEFIVKDNPQNHKIFDNLEILSNKAAPESFHYEIVGECYDFGNLKKIAYIRQEKLKKLYTEGTNNLVDLHYNEDLPTCTFDENSFLYRGTKYNRAIVFPQYYCRQNIKNQIYDNYKSMGESSHDYDALSGTELIRYKKLDEYRLCNHVKAVDTREKGGLLRGNMQYKEDMWYVQINPINYCIINESQWKTTDNANTNDPPVIIPNIQLSEPTEITVPDDMKKDNIVANLTNLTREEVAIKDKYIRIRIRYSGKDLAIISAINTLYRKSYT